ncbi:hypothetical protein DYB32_007163 [Aphanomyces invadans]|uniref:FYVE-type domain-containing protein n=1 Tax=Aphanomyces invadans TaxID=157072 RepID=A0A3R6ZLX4_9STRA|nr:hypothetical protein DYB32_007163 [Aphanomyces invadans]
MKKRVLTMSAQLNMYFKLMQAATSSAATLHNVVSTKQCASCFRPFKTFETKRSCATCYDRVCKACLTTGFVAEYNKELPVCVRCVLKDAAATHDGKSSSDAPRSSQDSVSSTRSTTHHPPRSIVSRVAPQTYKILQLDDDDDDDDVDMMEPRDTQSFIILDDEPDKPELDTVLDHRHKLIRLDGSQHCNGNDQSTPTKPNQGDDRAVTSSVASTLVESRLSILSDDGEDAMSSVVWHDAISKFHSNLRQFKETMHHSRRVPTPTHRHSSCSYPYAPAQGVWLASSNSVP